MSRVRFIPTRRGTVDSITRPLFKSSNPQVKIVPKLPEQNPITDFLRPQSKTRRDKYTVNSDIVRLPNFEASAPVARIVDFDKIRLFDMDGSVKVRLDDKTINKMFEVEETFVDPITGTTKKRRKVVKPGDLLVDFRKYILSISNAIRNGAAEINKNSQAIAPQIINRLSNIILRNGAKITDDDWARIVLIFNRLDINSDYRDVMPSNSRYVGIGDFRNKQMAKNNMVIINAWLETLRAKTNPKLIKSPVELTEPVNNKRKFVRFMKTIDILPFLKNGLKLDLKTGQLFNPRDDNLYDGDEKEDDIQIDDTAESEDEKIDIVIDERDFDDAGDDEDISEMKESIKIDQPAVIAANKFIEKINKLPNVPFDQLPRETLIEMIDELKVLKNMPSYKTLSLIHI